MMNTRLSTKLQRLLQLSCFLALLAPAAARGDGSVAFNASTSKLQHLTASVVDGNEMTICAWVYPTGAGGNGAGVVVALDESAGGVSLEHGAGSTLKLKANFDMTPGEWSFPVSHNKWSAVAVTYNKVGTGNDAQARVDFVDMTESEVSPVGNVPTINSGYCVGNVVGQTKGWEGRIAHVQIFNRILTTDELDACLQAPGSVRDGLKLWLPMTNASDIEDRSGIGSDGGATLLTTDISGPAITAQPGALPGITILNAGWIPVTQYVIPRYANGKTHPAGQLRGQGMISVIQGTEYGSADGSDPQRIVVTEDWDEEILRQWDFGPADDGEDPPTQLEEAVLQPVVRDLSILGKVDVAGYDDTDGETDVINSNTPGLHNPRFPHGDRIDFNGTTSKLENTGADVLNGSKKVTVCCWINPDGRGENTIGHVFLLDEAAGTSSFFILHGADNTLTISKAPGNMGTSGVWTIPITDGKWNAVCVRLDFSGDNAPTARVNFKNVTVTQSTAPSGTDDQPSAGYCVGNRQDQIATWDGRIAHMQVFNDILTDGEADDALNDPGSVETSLRLHLPMDGETDTGDLTTNNFDGTPTDLDTGPNFHDREIGLYLRASGPLVENVGFFHIAGTACMNLRDSNDLAGPVQPFDREMATLQDLSVYRSYSGFLIGTIDTEVGNLEGEYLRDWGVKVPPGVGGVKFEGAVHMSGVKNEDAAPAAFGTAAWFENGAGTCWGSGPRYCETSDVGMRIGSSGNKFTNFFSKDCVYRNLWFENTSQRNSVMNFEIDVENGVTEDHGCEAVLIAGQSNMLANGTIGGDHAVPAGEIAIRITNGTRQVIRDVDILGTSGSSAPLITVEGGHNVLLNDSLIVAKCFDAGTFLELFPVYASGKARAGAGNNEIRLTASHAFVNDELNGMTVAITAGTGSMQSRTITDYNRSTNTATVSPDWTTNPANDSTYEVRVERLGTGNFISLTTAGTVTKAVNLDPNGWDDWNNTIAVDGVVQSSPTVELTIASGAITLTQRNHVVDTESEAASDDLTTINGGIAGRTIILRAAHTDRTVVVKDGVGNLKLENDFSLDNTEDTITLFHDGTNWLEKARRSNGG